MKKVYLILAAAAAVMTLSCNKELTVQNDSAESIIKTFTCAIDSDVDSKVAIPDNGKAVWEVGDEIYVHGKYFAQSVTHALTSEEISADGKKATFSIDLSGVEAYAPDGYYACYPASAVKYFSSSEKSYYYGEFNDTNKPLMAAYLKGDTFRFYNLCGVLTFKVSGDFDEYVFSGNDKETIGYGQYQVKINSEDKNYARTVNNPIKSLRAPVTSDGTFVHKVCFPNGVELTKGFTIKFLKGGEIVKAVSTKETYSVNIARGKLLPLGDVTSKLKDYVAPTTHSSSITPVPADDSDENLSKSASANCYVVDASVAGNANKIFKFKAVKGNSTATLSQIESAEIVWETYNNSETVTANSVIAAVDYDLQEGGDPYVVFKMPETLHAGNVLIAAKSGSGKVLWSWHIWVPSTSIEPVIDEVVFGPKAIMDRNLGALVAAPAASSAPVESYGMLYQWGRKDPFPGMDAVAHDAKAKVAGTATTSVDGTFTIEEAIQNPTMFAKSADEKDWVTIGADQSNVLWNTTKTIYDPCPVGYIVPTRNTSVAYWSGTNLDLLPADDHFADNGTTYGSYVIGTGTLIVFPFTGYIQMSWGDHYKSGKRSYIWSSYASSYGGNIDKAYAVYARSVKDSSTSNEYKRTEKGKCLGASVRCVAE